MRQLELNDEENTVLLEALHVYLKEFRREVARTEDRDYRRALHAKQDVLERLVGVLAHSD